MLMDIGVTSSKRRLRTICLTSIKSCLSSDRRICLRKTGRFKHLNTYLKEFLALPAHYRRNPAHPLVNGAESGMGREYRVMRETMCERFSWAVPTNEAVDRIVAFAGKGGVIEIGCGNGYWLSLLSQHLPYVGIDACPVKRQYVKVVKGTERFLSTCDAIYLQVLLLCWPPYKSPMALRSLEMWKGPRLVYIGEQGARGCAEPMFFHKLATDWRLVEEVDIPQWFNRSDKVYLYTRA